MNICKTVVIGDGAVGKTCMLHIYAKKDFPTTYIPTIFDNYTATVDVDSTPIQLNLWDTAGQEEFDKLRVLSYPNTHVFIICFSVDSRTSFRNIPEQWLKEIGQYLKPPTNARIVLVGTKSDQRGKVPAGQCVTKEEAEALAAEIGAFKYVECSAKEGFNVKAVFDEAIRARFTIPGGAAPTPAGSGGQRTGGAPAPPVRDQAKKKPKKTGICTIL
eukprot:PhF_6_TR26972/c0_g1_i1/m.39345